MTYYTLANNDITIVSSEKQKKQIKDIKRGHRLIIFSLTGILIMLSIFYVFSISGIVKNTYDLRMLNKKLEELKNQNQILETEVLKLRKIDLKSSAAPLNLVAIDKIEYIDIKKDNSFAMTQNRN